MKRIVLCILLSLVFVLSACSKIQNEEPAGKNSNEVLVSEQSFADSDQQVSTSTKESSSETRQEYPQDNEKQESSSQEEAADTNIQTSEEPTQTESEIFEEESEIENTAEETEGISVPNLLSLTKDEAQEYLEEAGLKLGNVNQTFSCLFQEGRIVSQEIEEGEEVAEGTTIDIIISKGPLELGEITADYITIPQPYNEAQNNGVMKVIVYDSEQAATTIYENGVSYSTFATLGGVMLINYPDDALRVEVYFDDILAANEEIIVDDPADVEIIDEEKGKCMVPDLFGKTLEECQSLLTEQGLVLGDVSEEYSETVPEGSIIEQGTEEGTEVDKGTSIDVIISRGPQPTDIDGDNGGTISISQPFDKADQIGVLTVIAYDMNGNMSTLFENGVSYSTFASLGGIMNVNYPAGTQRIEVYLDDNLLMSEEINS